LLRESRNLYELEQLFSRVPSNHCRWLKWIDPYGDTVLNRLQIPDFLEQWNALREFAATDSERATLEAVQQIAEFCLEEPHRYLRFYGD
jgi:hypothetical protein